MTAISPPASGLAAPTSRARPTAGIVDGAFVIVLGALGLIGFRSLYGGVRSSVVGCVGLVLGVAVAELVRRWRRSVLIEGVLSLLVFLLLGGALASHNGGVLVPTPGVVRSLGHVGIDGWKELLTTAPPVGDASDLLAIPYVVGLVGGVVGQSLARRTRLAAAPLAGPVLVLALGILFGARHPASLLAQGSCFAGLALAWVAVRHHRRLMIVAGRRPEVSRLAIGAAFVAGAVALGGLLAPHLPGADRPRVVLSKYVTPPFDASLEASPLAGFRTFATDGQLNRVPLFRVSGLPAGATVRIVAMDVYNGIDWGFGSTAGSEDVFERFGSILPTDQPGRAAQVTVRIGALGGVWLPDLAGSRRVSFAGPDAVALASGLRYDPSTSTAAEPQGLTSGEQYQLQAVVSPTPTRAELLSAAAGAQSVTVEPGSVPPVLQADANQWIGGANSAWAKVSALASSLLTRGYYSDGNEVPPLASPGHGSGRLATFLEGGGLVGTDIVGDDEQYAATLALMADAVGVPARVVLGVPHVPAGGLVVGADVRAWVEVSLARLGWVPVLPASFIPTRSTRALPPTQQPNASASPPVQPPVQTAIRSPLQDQLPGQSGAAIAHGAQHRPAPPSRLPGWIAPLVGSIVAVVAAVAVLVGAVTGLKARRRSRRRRRGRAVDQAAAAWSELVDAARDAGTPIPVRATRREQAAVFSLAEAGVLAGHVDAVVFGPGDVSDRQARQVWSAADRIRAELRRALGRRARWRAALSLRSLRPSVART